MDNLTDIVLVLMCNKEKIILGMIIRMFKSIIKKSVVIYVILIIGIVNHGFILLLILNVI